MRRLYKQRCTSFGRTRNNIDIWEYPLKHPRQFPNTGIKFNRAYEEWSACTDNGLDLWQWHSGKYSREFMVNVIAFWRLKNYEKQHSADASIKKSK